MDRCVVLVDAGYLLGAAASLLAGESSRSRITVDHTELIKNLRERAEAETGLPLLRIYWFDAAPDRRPMPEHRRLRVTPRVTVRLGALTRADGRWVQKGVDAAMHAELSELARNRACADVVLVTGDGDLLPGMMSAKEHGVAVHLWAVQAADGDFNQSEDLVAEADERRVLDRDWITRAVEVREITPPCPPPMPRPEIAKILSAPHPSASSAVPPPPVEPGAGGAENGTRPEPGPAGPAGAARPTGEPGPAGGGPEEDPECAAKSAAPGGRSVPTPKEIAAGLASGKAGAATSAGAGAPGAGAPPGAPAPSLLRWSSDKGWIERSGDSAGPAELLPTLAQLTTAEQRWADREEDITAIGGDPHEVGQVFAKRWSDRLGDRERLPVLWAEYPRVPHRIDGELLRYAARFGLLAHKDDQIDEHDRYAIRAGFWREISARVPGASLVDD
ncbi:NYN domain-containing protein [Phaeacidiphilus oryzae]|uniref:NYN domain-containing protein n=1 Tax=Phaeacidiphilus oryzae TaxID=348818 RepID=UPI0006907FFA|nr:NYN domain-containing protein [Phaeacidiphilus oryzae]